MNNTTLQHRKQIAVMISRVLVVLVLLCTLTWSVKGDEEMIGKPMSKTDDVDDDVDVISREVEAREGAQPPGIWVKRI